MKLTEGSRVIVRLSHSLHRHSDLPAAVVKVHKKKAAGAPQLVDCRVERRGAAPHVVQEVPLLESRPDQSVPGMVAWPAPEERAVVAPPPPPPALTRDDLDQKLGALPGAATDANVVVGDLRSAFGDLFTPEDEQKVRELVKASGNPNT